VGVCSVDELTSILGSLCSKIDCKLEPGRYQMIMPGRDSSFESSRTWKSCRIFVCTRAHDPEQCTRPDRLNTFCAARTVCQRTMSAHVLSQSVETTRPSVTSQLITRRKTLTKFVIERLRERSDSYRVEIMVAGCRLNEMLPDSS